MKEVIIRRGAVYRRFVVVAVALAVYAGLTAGLFQWMSRPGETAADPRIVVVQGERAPTRNIAIRDGWFWVDGERFLIRSVGWDPARPGELPWQRPFRAAELEADLERIQAAGFNTVRTWAPLRPEELALVAKHRLRVLQGIWIDPAGSFADPAFRRRALADVVTAVETSRFSPAILGYVVLNEPRAQAVAAAGLDDTRAFLREAIATVRALDASAPIGYASWPGMEALDDPLCDFVAFNLYPHRPRVVMDDLGLAGYVAMLKRTVARGRPLVITEFGISVSPKSQVRGRGGATEAEQATGLVELANTFIGGGATGTSVFQWNDGWWKNHDKPGDETEHDPTDPEEWFGLIRFASLEDRIGVARPALTALAQLNRAVLLEPMVGAAVSGVVPVRIASREPIRLEVSVNGGPRYPIELWSPKHELYEGKLFVPSGGTREDFTFYVLDAAGDEIRHEHRLLRTAGARSLSLAMTPVRQQVAPGEAFRIEVRASGDGAGALGVTVATFAEDRFHEEKHHVTTDADGRAVVELQAPSAETIIAVIVFEDAPAVPPAERAAAWSVVEVRP